MCVDGFSQIGEVLFCFLFPEVFLKIRIGCWILANAFSVAIKIIIFFLSSVSLLCNIVNYID